MSGGALSDWIEACSKEKFAVLTVMPRRTKIAIEARKAFVAQLDGYLFNGVPEHLQKKLLAK